MNLHHQHGASTSSSGRRSSAWRTQLHGGPSPRAATSRRYYSDPAAAARQQQLQHLVLTVEPAPTPQHERDDIQQQQRLTAANYGPAGHATLLPPSGPPPAVQDTAATLRSPIATLQAYAVCSSKAAMTPAARQAGITIRETVADAINNKAANLRSLQMLVGSSKGVVDALVHLAQQGHMLGFEVLQLLCYRNTIACQQLLDRSVVETISDDLPSSGTSMQCVMCALLTTLAAFNQGSHARIQASGLIPVLVMLCRQAVHVGQSPEDSPQALKQLENQASAVLRNLSHNPAMHATLIQAGAVDALVRIMRGKKKRQQQVASLQDPELASTSSGDQSSGHHQLSRHTSFEVIRPLQVADGSIPAPVIVSHDKKKSKAAKAAAGRGADAVVKQAALFPAAVLTATLGDDADGTEWEEARSRINAALAVAILVGHEEGAANGLELDEELVGQLMEALEAAIQGALYLGVFWTAWKLCQGLANLTVNEKNRELFAARRGVQLMAEVLLGRHDNEEAAHRYALSALWNLAFEERCRLQMRATPGLVDAIRTILATTEAPATREAAKGALWTLGLGNELRGAGSSGEAAGNSSPDSGSSSAAADADSSFGANGAGLSHGVASSRGHIMLSYEWGQQSSVLLIKSELQRAGYSTWMDVDLMSGSTLEAMAKAVEGSAVVLVCLSKKYKESQACRTEAEYAFQQRKKIVPVLMEGGYQPTGWLGALIGARRFIDMSNSKSITGRMPTLFQELGDLGKPPPSVAVPGSSVKGMAAAKQASEAQLTSGSASTEAASSAGLADDSPSAAGAGAEAGARTGSTGKRGRADHWTCDDVGAWLERQKCGQYAPTFRQQSMDGRALCGLLRLSTSDPRLVHEMLEGPLGVQNLGHRLRLMEALHKLFIRGAAHPSPM